MVTNRKSLNQKDRISRRPTKAELERQKAVRRMQVSLTLAVILVFAAFKLGFFGILIYNLIRVFFGSLSYLIIAAILFYIFFFKWLKKNEGMMSGFSLILLGLLVSCEAYFAKDIIVDGRIFSTIFATMISDLVSGQISNLPGGGLIGSIFYVPISFLFSNMGSYFIGFLLVGTGFLVMSPWSIYDLSEVVRNHFCNLSKKKRKSKEKEREKADKQQIELRQEDKESDATPVCNDVISQVLIDSDEKDSGVIKTGEDLHDPIGPSKTQEKVDVDIDFHPTEPLAYELPSINLLADEKPKSRGINKQMVKDNIKVLENTFASFGIRVSVKRAEIGPSVTKYEVKPAVGVRVNRISNLADDLALALATKDVRIESPIPGKALVGIEVPNSEVATVSFNELWRQSKTDSRNLLEIPIGRSINGKSYNFDLAKLPHLLIAGSTGSGKSVLLNGIIVSILLKARPDEVKFMMVDPKMVELSVYNEIPHLLIPVVTNPHKASRALKKVVNEMESRYELFSQFRVRNISGYNAKVSEWSQQSDANTKHVVLPLIVVIVDELADLMMVASKEVEDAIIRLGQKARAAGIHMVLATQRPSVDVISGLIKANIPSRIAFAVSSGTDSRTILDENGAEKLLGSGDMLFKPIDENHPVRLQGAFISDQDVDCIVGFVKRQAGADYDDSFDPGETSELESENVSDDEDPLFEEAKALVIGTQKASAAMLQRRLSVGFNRATRLLEDLELAGVVGPAEGTKPRKVLQIN